MKKITAFLLAAIIAIGTAACGKSKIEAEPEQSSATVTAAQTELTTAETTMQATTEETVTESNIYLMAKDNDFDVLMSILQQTIYCGCWPDGFDRADSTFSDDMVAVVKIIDTYYGTKTMSHDGVVIPEDFKGLTEYRYDEFDYGSDSHEEIYKKHRKSFDPLFKFENLDDSMFFYFSADAGTVEWVEEELLGGTADKTGFTKNDEWEECCYYFEGRYYFQISGHNGRIPQFSLANSERLDDGRYNVTFNVSWYSDYTFTTTAAVIDNNGDHYWKLFKIDWRY